MEFLKTIIFNLEHKDLTGKSLITAAPNSFKETKTIWVALNHTLFRQHNHSSLPQEPRWFPLIRSAFPHKSNLTFCFQNQIDLIVRHIPRQLNVGADLLQETFH